MPPLTKLKLPLLTQVTFNKDKSTDGARTVFNACFTSMPYISFSMDRMHRHVHKSHVHTCTHTHTHTDTFIHTVEMEKGASLPLPLQT